MLQVFKYLLLFFYIFFFTSAKAIESNWSISNESKVRIFSPNTHNNNNNEIFLGLEYELKEGWKTYWQSPGDGGFPQEIIWDKSKNVSSLEVLWPTPNYFEILDINSIGYSDKVIFPLKIYLIDSSKPTLVTLDINYLVCKDICIPGNANLKLQIPSGKGNLTNHAFYLEKSLSQLPISSNKLDLIDNKKINIFSDKKNISFYFSILSKETFIDPVVFLHTKYGLPVVNPEIKLSKSNKQLEAKFTFNKNLIKDDKVDTTFIIADKNQSIEVNEITSLTSDNIKINNNYFYIIFIAFLGGIILNGMPCVLPVLSIKVLSMLQHLDKPSAIRKSFILTSLGIISSFVILALSFIILRYFGTNIGWGMQFQQPLFLMVIIFILTFFAFNLFGFYEISIPNFIQKKVLFNEPLKSNSKDFFNGFLTTLMATPCSAPFVGTAITAAFTQSMIMMLLIFLFMSFGLALPYLLVAIYPKLIFYFPKPGRWMLYLKYFLGLLLLLTLVWIGNILLNHYNYYLIISLIILLIIMLSLSNFLRIKKTILFISIIIFFSLPYFSIFKASLKKEITDWLDFNNINIQELVLQDNIIFVDITADWCATCQYNKINVLNSSQISEIFTKFKVIKIKGDWTKPDDKIEKFLQENNKFGIPFNIIYNKNNIEGIILPELLSKKEIIKIFEKL